MTSLERDVLFLKRYAVASTTLFLIMSVAAFARPARHEKFTEIDVERINVMEPNGNYRMVISNRPRSIGPIYKGKPFGYAGGGRPGIIFFNDEGTENGGLTFTGARDSTGKVRASTHMSFDQFNSDQVLNLDYNEGGGQRLVGISVLDRAPVDIFDWVAKRDSLRRLPAGAARDTALAHLADPVNGDAFQAQRVFLGRDPNKAAALVLSDRAGKPRIRIAVDSAGTPAVEFLDAAGRVTSRVPDSRK